MVRDPQRSASDRDSAATMTLHPAVRAVSFGAFRFDRTNRILLKEGIEVSLPPRALAILDDLLERKGEVVSKQELMDRVWHGSYVSETSLTEAVSLLRQALGDDPQQPEYIQTVHRRGYRFVANVSAEPFDQPTSGPLGRQVSSSRSVLNLAVRVAIFSALMATAFVAGRLFIPRVSRPERPPTRFVIDLPLGQSLVAFHPALAISPNGRDVVYIAKDGAKSRLFYHSLATMETKGLEGTEDASSPFFSPDGEWIGFFADGRLKRVPRTGGSAIEICQAPKAYGGSWGSDDRIVFAGITPGGLLRVPATGGATEIVTTPDYAGGEVGHQWPEVLPDGRGVVFTIWSTTVHTAKVAVLDLETGAIRELVDGASGARYAADGRLVYSYAGALVAAPFDLRRLEMTGPASIVLEGVTAGIRYGEAQFAISSTGTIIYLPGNPETAHRELASWSEEESLTSLAFEPRFFRNMKVGPEGRRLAVTALDGARSDVWIASAEQGTLSRLTFEGFNIEPTWSPDGQWLSFASNRTGPFDIYRKKADGTGEAEELLKSKRHQYPQSWTADGRKILFTEHHPETGFDLWLLDLTVEEESDGRLEPLLTSAADEFEARFSPDGRWFTYASNESGRWEIYVQPYPSEGGKWQVSTDGGHTPFWSGDGRHIFYQDGDRIISVAFEPESEMRIGSRKALLERDDLITIRSHPAKEQFIMIKELDERDPLDEIRVILDWFDSSRVVGR